MSRDKGLEMPVAFPPPPQLPPRRPVPRSTHRPARINSIDLLETVVPVPTLQTLHDLLEGPVSESHQPSLSVSQTTQPIFSLSNSLHRLESLSTGTTPSLPSSSVTPVTPSILISNDGYTLNNSSTNSTVYHHNHLFLHSYERLSSARTGISHSWSAPNGFNQLNQTNKNSQTDIPSSISGINNNRDNHLACLNYATISNRRPLSTSPSTTSVSQSLKLRSGDTNSSDLIDLATIDDLLMERDVLSLFDPLKIDDEPAQQVPTTVGAVRGSADSSSAISSSSSSSSTNDRVSSTSRTKFDDKKVFNTDYVAKSSKSLPSSPRSDGTKRRIKVTLSSSTTTGRQVSYGKFLAVEKKDIKTIESVEHFLSKLKAIRGKYRWDDPKTNSGLVVSPVIETQSYDSLSVKLVIRSNFSTHPITFTCNVKTSVEHIISHAVCSLMDDASSVDFDSFVLKVFGRNEFLEPSSILADYSYVLECNKFDRDVGLVLVRENDVDRIFARTEEDDIFFFDVVTTETILPEKVLAEYSSINFNVIKILLQTLDREVERLLTNCRHERILHSNGVVQAVKAIVSVLGNIETESIQDKLKDLTDRIRQLSDLKERGIIHYSDVDESRMTMIETSMESIYESISQVISLYSRTFPVDFALVSPESSYAKSRVKMSNDVTDEIIIFVGQLSQPPIDWNTRYRKFFCLVELFHGTKKIAGVRTQSSYLTESCLKLKRIQFEEWVTFNGVSLSNLPRETCIYFSIHGVEYVDTDDNPIKREVTVLLSMSMFRLFDEEEKLLQGHRLLSMWEKENFEKNKLSVNCPNLKKDAPLLTITLPDYEYNIIFPPISPDSSDLTPIPKDYRDLGSLPSETQTSIYQVLNRPVEEMFLTDREVIWANRGNLIQKPDALPKVLTSCKNWDYESLHEIYSLVTKWSELSVIDAMQLLLPTFPDRYIRKKAVGWITTLNFDGLICDFLPQLVQAIRFEPYLDSPLVFYLLEMSLKSVRVAHQLYWLLKENVDDPLLGFRSSLILKSLKVICGASLETMIDREERFQNQLTSVSDSVKMAKENSRLALLQRSLETVDEFLRETKMTPLPLSPSLLVSGLVITNCSYFTSNTLPLKLTFLPTEANCPDSIVETIFKVGDDLRQDTLTMQIIRIMDKLWLKEGLDLKIVTFDCVSTDDRKGFVQMISHAETLRKIQTDQGGLAGTLNERSIIEWLKKNNTDELDFTRAKENFVHSCAGYAVATYILGICDRHNDNIMITTSGHLFHIDFGKFLGDSQMMGSIKRDRVPFILSKEMVYTINGGSDSSKNFQFFVELCCHAFTIIRRHTNLFLSLFSLMTSSSIPGVTNESVKFVQQALLPELSETEAMAVFAQKIDESSRALSVQLNFLVHTLAQLRFTGDHNDQRLLSFVPKTCTKDTDGRIKHVQVVFSFKKKDPEKQYFHVVRVDRDKQVDPFFVARTFGEFYEFYQKLSSLFPLARIKLSSSGSSTFRRVNTREVADKRRKHIHDFLIQLMSLSDEVSHSDLVYTFFQPLLRDQELQEVGVFAAASNQPMLPSTSGFFTSRNEVSSLQRRPSLPDGQVQLSIVYKNDSLVVMIRHAKHLQSKVTSDRQPNTYAKTKLTPDPRNETKRKTKIVGRNSNPSFMELVVYNYSLSFLQQKVLNVSVWEVDRMKGNIYLGAALVPLGQMDLNHETISWYPFTG